MRLWTIQARQAWERVHASPYLERAGARPAIDPAHRAAYGWMREQMRKRIGASSAQEAWQSGSVRGQNSSQNSPSPSM